MDFNFWRELHSHSNCFSPREKVFFLLLFSRFVSLSSHFSNVNMMFLGMDVLGLILFGIFSASWICRIMSFAKFGDFGVIISLNSFPDTFFPLSFRDSCHECENFLLNPPTVPCDFVHLSFIFFFSFFLLFFVLFRLGNFCHLLSS